MFDGVAANSLARHGRSAAEGQSIGATVEPKDEQHRATASVQRVTDVSAAAVVHLSKDGLLAMARGRGPPRSPEAKPPDKADDDTAAITKFVAEREVGSKPAGVTLALQRYRQASTSRIAGAELAYRHKDLPVPLPSPLPPSETDTGSEQS